MDPALPVSASADKDGAFDATAVAVAAEQRRLRRLSLRLGALAAGIYAVAHVALSSSFVASCEWCHTPHIWLRW